MPPISSATHALVDGVCYPDAWKRLYRHDSVEEVEPLYLSTRWSAVAEHGPMLVTLKGAGLISQASQNDHTPLYRSLSLLSSQASTQSLSKHLRRFITFNSEAGQEQLLRFADPLVTRHWLRSYGDELPAILMGSINTWWVADWTPNWAGQRAQKWQAFQASHHPESTPAAQAPDFPPMGHQQYAALKAVARWQLKERLTDYFKQHVPNAWQRLKGDHGRWLDERLDDAIAWGASTERQLAIWVDLSLHWGKALMTADDGLYAQWARHSSDQVCLPRQEQLYALDAWSRTPAAGASQRTQNYGSPSQAPLSVDEEANG
tara:strand:+ start:265 stop:1218 length:954 start_codon:yes stop_codon:yes gene_type:complete